MRGYAAVAAFFVAAGLTVGCGRGPATGEVSGTVSYDGAVVENGSIAFYPADGQGPSAGAAIAGGKYTVAKVSAGVSKVRISGVKDGKMKKMYDDPGSKPVMTSTELLPPKYSDDLATEIRYEVTPGAQTKNFELAK